MSERVDLTVAITPPSITNYHVDYLTLNIDTGQIVVHLAGNNGESLFKTYDSTTNPTGASLISTLNTSNNSAGTSLIKRVYNRLITDGVLVGTVSGSPS